MKDTLLWVGVGSFVGGLIIRFNAKSLSWERVSSMESILRDQRVIFFDQTGLLLSVFGLLVCLLVFHHVLSRDDS
jgi:hypothetical protein